jgi:hypothetical protein
LGQVVLGKQTAVISDATFTASIVVTLLTTLAAPVLLRLTLPRGAAVAAAERSHLRLLRQIEQLQM